METKFTISEFNTLQKLFSTIDLKDLLSSAEMGFKVLDQTSNNSIYAEYANICNVLLKSL